MKLKSTLLALAAMTGTSQAATITPVLKVNFSGTISGNTYTLGVGELDTTSSFVGNGNPTVSGGKADLAGSVASDPNAQGFEINPGSIVGSNWVAESRVSFDSFGGGQRTVISVQGDTAFRINNGGTLLEANYWDGSTSGTQTTALPTMGTEVHLALVWDAAATSLTAYVNGTALPTINNNAYKVPDATNLSFGYFGRDTLVGRGIDGKLDGVAFSTFTGTFDKNSDFQLAVPEPSSVALLGLGGLLGLLRRRRA